MSFCFIGLGGLGKLCFVIVPRYLVYELAGLVYEKSLFVDWVFFSLDTVCY